MNMQVATSALAAEMAGKKSLGSEEREAALHHSLWSMAEPKLHMLDSFAPQECGCVSSAK